MLADVGAADGDGDEFGAAGLYRLRVCARSRYLPVPSSRRELNSRLPMRNISLCLRCCRSMFTP